MLESIANIVLVDVHSVVMTRLVRHVLMDMNSQREICVLNALEQHTSTKGSALRSHTARQEHLASPLPHAQSVILGLASQPASRALGTSTATGAQSATRLTTAIQL